MTTTSPASPTAIAAADVINSATPIETDLLGIHPRMLCIKHPFTRLRAHLGTDPWKGWFAELVKQGQSLLAQELPATLMGTPPHQFDVRHLGEQMILLALLARLTDDASCRTRLAYLMQRLTDEKDWGHSLIYGHWARGFAFALDWMWHDLDAATRNAHVETLYTRTRQVFDAWATYRSGEPFGYTWNISAVVLGGVTATAACLYGERPDIAPIMNLAWEKMRLQSLALGPDGVSPEGIMYGGYYTSYLIISFLLAEDLMGFDLFETTPWLARHARSLHAQTVARTSWRSDNVFFNQGDAHGHAFGHESILRIIASRLKDETAQWFADEFLESGKMGTSPFSFLLHDPEVKPVAPTTRPPFDYLEDYGIVIMRSDWSGTESACAVKCGPNVGHHAARRFTHPLGGGHMHPNNGDVQIFAHDAWILAHPGYVWKDTSYHNTILINGTGQLGDQSEWLEDLPYRRQRKYPFMGRAEHHGAWDYCMADMTNAYPDQSGLTALRRFVFYLRPDTWIIIDAMESARPVTLTQLFHTGFPVAADGVQTFSGHGTTAACQIRIHAPATVVATLEEQPLLHTSRTPQGTMNLLRLTTPGAAVRHLCVTEIQAYPSSVKAPPSIGITVSAREETVHLPISGSRAGITIHPFRGDTPITGA